jgi:hypothetical protein
MNQRYPTAAAFRQAVEDRVRVVAEERGVPINDLRQKLVMERLLVRLFSRPGMPWLLKGGYAMDLRYRPSARTTRDLDLTVSSDLPDLFARLDAFREQLQEAGGFDADDYLVFRVGVARGELTVPPEGGARFPVVAVFAGREYARFHVDAGFGDAVIGEPEVLTGDDFFAFAGLSPAKAVAIPKPQQFAEKIHAYTFVWTDRANTRVKDLVDLVILIERGQLDPERTMAAVTATFAKRRAHDVPRALADPPAAWAAEFGALAKEAGISVTHPQEAIEIVQSFWATM